MSSGNAMTCETIRGSKNAVNFCVITLLMEGCDGPKSSLLHGCIFPVAKYLNVVITLISGTAAFLRCIGDVSFSLIRSLTNTIPARSNQ